MSALPDSAVPAAAAGRRALPADSVRLLRTIAMSVGIQGPTAGVIVGPAVLASIVGPSGALAYLLGLIAMGFVAYAFVLFTRSFNSAGSVYAFTGTTLGAGSGFVCALLLLLVYVAFAAGVYASTADIAGSLLASFGVHVAWQWIALAGWALTMVLAYVSFSLSAVAILLCEGIAVMLIAVVGVAALTHHGPGHASLSPAPFATHGIAVSVLGLGVVNAFSAFSGFEGAATLGEESVRARRTIPLAVAGSLIGSAAVYIVFTWIVDNAYPSAAALAAAPAPFVHLATLQLGLTMGRLVNLAGVISAFGAQLACVNAANRLLFALGRDLGGGARGARALTRISPRHGSPTGALAMTGPASAIVLAAFALEPTAVRALTFILEYGAYLILVVYLLTVVAALVLVWRTHRRALPLLVLALGVVVLAYVLRDTFTPLPAGPFRWVGIAAAASLGFAALLTRVPGLRERLRGSPLLRVARVETSA